MAFAVAAAAAAAAASADDILWPRSDPKAALLGLGDKHTVLLRSNGTVVACGANDAGQCDIPELPSGLSYTQVSAGAEFTALLRCDGNVVVCGSGNGCVFEIPPLSAGLFYVRIAAGDCHLVLLRSDGKLLAVGENWFQQLDVPEVADMDLAHDLLCGDRPYFTDIVAGAYHSVALKSDGSAVAWGRNDDGQCDVPPLSKDGLVWYTSAAAGMFHTLLLKSNGDAVAFGDSESAAENAVAVPNLPAGVFFTQVACGAEHSIFLRSDGLLEATGSNDEWGQCEVPSGFWDSVVVAAGGGGWHTVVLMANGQVDGFGRNDVNQLQLEEAAGPGISYVVDRLARRLYQAMYLSEGRVLFSTLRGERVCEVKGETFRHLWIQIQKTGRCDALFWDGARLSDLVCSNEPTRSYCCRIHMRRRKVKNRKA